MTEKSKNIISLSESAFRPAQQDIPDGKMNREGRGELILDLYINLDDIYENGDSLVNPLPFDAQDLTNLWHVWKAWEEDITGSHGSFLQRCAAIENLSATLERLSDFYRKKRNMSCQKAEALQSEITGISASIEHALLNNDIDKVLAYYPYCVTFPGGVDEEAVHSSDGKNQGENIVYLPLKTSRLCLRTHMAQVLSQITTTRKAHNFVLSRDKPDEILEREMECEDLQHDAALAGQALEDLALLRQSLDLSDVYTTSEGAKGQHRDTSKLLHLPLKKIS